MSYSETVVDSVDSDWIKGRTIRYQDETKDIVENITSWTKISDEAHEKSCWMLRAPQDLLNSIDIKIEKENADYLQKIFEEDWTSGVYFFNTCCTGLKEYGSG